MSLIYKLAQRLEKKGSNDFSIVFNQVTNTCRLEASGHLICTIVLNSFGHPTAVLFGNTLEEDCLSFELTVHKWNIEEMFEVLDTKLFYLGLDKNFYNIKYKEGRGICLTPSTDTEARCEIDRHYVDMVLSIFDYQENVLGKNKYSNFLEFYGSNTNGQWSKRVVHTKGEFEILQRQLKILNTLHSTHATE